MNHLEQPGPVLPVVRDIARILLDSGDEVAPGKVESNPQRLVICYPALDNKGDRNPGPVFCAL